MISLTTLISIMVVLNTVSLMVFLYGSRAKQHQAQETITGAEDFTQFVHEFAALQILNQLDVPIDSEVDYNAEVKLGLVNDPSYCNKTRQEFVSNPETIFNEIWFMTDYNKPSITKGGVLLQIGTDAMPAVRPGKSDENKKARLPLHPKLNTVYTNGALQPYLPITRSVACLTQSYNHVPGISSLNRKDRVANNSILYAQKYKDRPQCFNGDKFFPKTWLLEDPEQCKLWFDYLNTPEYAAEKAEKNIVYIRKVGKGGHQGKFVQPVDEDEEKALRQKFANGKLCGQTTTTHIIQDYIQNPLLVRDISKPKSEFIKGHKFDFRVYLMIASTNPVIAYYHDGFLRVSLYEYDVHSNEKGMHLTNTAQSSKVFKQAADQEIMGMNETELRNFQMWNFTRLADYLIHEGKIESRAWIDDYLRPSFMHAMQHLIRMTQGSYIPTSSAWELFGCDFMIDENLGIWFIECNSGPSMVGTNEEKDRMLTKMLKDCFEIVTAQLRSRIKRVLKYVNWLVEEDQIRIEKGKNVIIPKLEQRQTEFAEITKNYMEEEFEISSDNTWWKVVDETKDGLERYNGKIRTECYDV